MKNLKFKFDLDSKVAIYVPSTTNISTECDNIEQVRTVIGKLSAMFGGATASEAVGGWVSQSGETIVERVTIVYAFCTTSSLSDNFEKVLEICNWLKNLMGQEAITLEVNGQVKFV